MNPTDVSDLANIETFHYIASFITKNEKVAFLRRVISVHLPYDQHRIALHDQSSDAKRMGALQPVYQSKVFRNVIRCNVIVEVPTTPYFLSLRRIVYDHPDSSTLTIFLGTAIEF
jgi:hypothetical protein